MTNAGHPASAASKKSGDQGKDRPPAMPFGNADCWCREMSDLTESRVDEYEEGQEGCNSRVPAGK